MFNTLSQYLFEFKKLELPHIGVLQLKNKAAQTDRAAAVISAPSWVVDFVASDTGNANDHVVQWLAHQQKITVDDAKSSFDNFIADILKNLEDGVPVNWPELGVLKKADNVVSLEAAMNSISPLTQVVAKKIIRENTSHQTLVGNTETTTAQMRDQLQFPEETRNKSAVVAWVIVGVALVAAVWFFTQKGCSTTAAGSQQKIEAAQSSDTYKLK